MSSVIPATCEGGVVTAQGVSVPSAQILSEGVGASSGVLHIQGSRAVYHPKTSPDLKATLESVIEALGEAAAGLTACSSAIGVVAPLAGVPGPAVPALTAPIDSAAGSLEDIAATLSELKDDLR